MTKQSTPKYRGGRKGLYHDWIEGDGLIKLEAWARDGLTDEQIAHNIGINVSTLHEWKKKYTEIRDALKRGKQVVDILVENALLKRALGYKYEEKTWEARKNLVTGETEMVLTKIIAKEVQPDTTAQAIWLNNRKPDNWKDRRYINQQVQQEIKTTNLEKRADEALKLNPETVNKLYEELFESLNKANDEANKGK